MKSWRNWLVGGIGIVVLIGLLSACGGGVDKGSDSTVALSVATPVQWSDTPAQNTITNAELADLDTAQSQTETVRLIIKDGTVQLQVDDAQVASDQITEIATRYGGYVLQTRLSNSDTRRTGTVELAVESAYFDAAIEDIQALAETVIYVSTMGTDVTEEYVDAESRLYNLEATRDRIRTFLDDAQDVTEALAVNAELSRIEGEIEQVKGRMTYLTGRAAFSTITVDLQEDVPPESETDQSLGATIDSALDTQADVLRYLVHLSLWLVIVVGPYLVIGGGVIALWYWLKRRRPAPSTPTGEDALVETE